MNELKLMFVTKKKKRAKLLSNLACSCAALMITVSILLLMDRSAADAYLKNPSTYLILLFMLLVLFGLLQAKDSFGFKPNVQKVYYNDNEFQFVMSKKETQVELFSDFMELSASNKKDPDFYECIFYFQNHFYQLVLNKKVFHDFSKYASKKGVMVDVQSRKTRSK